ncbi:hypothetical protein EYF80_030206 [Liparis tanakae]|uniref:Uncharacterized protein n=1 Tax=Liparis tanakae TaxID=230148 RepID=A0A4Z2H1B7_9TELE|nr:hypothetical protein EYF80_030206 [Liparis tanakae]
MMNSILGAMGTLRARSPLPCSHGTMINDPVGTNSERPFSQTPAVSSCNTKHTRAHPDRLLTDGAGFPPLAVQTRVKFCAWYRLNAAGVFSATTDMLFGGAVEDEEEGERERERSGEHRVGEGGKYFEALFEKERRLLESLLGSRRGAASISTCHHLRVHPTLLICMGYYSAVSSNHILPAAESEGERERETL